MPGSYPYSPSRTLIDYLGAAGGLTDRAKSNDVRIVRGSLASHRIMKANVKDLLRARSPGGSTTLEPGDIVYVPSNLIGGWRDALQLLFTSLSLGSLLRNL